MNYAISYKLRNNDLSDKEFALLAPQVMRVRASNATRAISTTINQLKAAGHISSKAEIVVLEARVVA